MQTKPPSCPPDSPKGEPEAQAKSAHRQEAISRRSHLAKQPGRAGIMGAFRVKRTPFPWERAIGSGVSAAIPILAATALGRLNHGLIANIGSFTFLYAGNEPYSKRARKLPLVLTGLLLSFGLGSLSASASLWLSALVFGVVGFSAIFLCEALDVPPPSGFFFIFTYTLGTSMPAADPATLGLQVGLVLLGGLPPILLALFGWIFNPHGAEIRAVVGTYRALAAWLEAVGTERSHVMQHQAAVALRSAHRTLTPGGPPWRQPGLYTRLLRLNQEADALFLVIIARTAETCEPVDPRTVAAMSALADAVTAPARAAAVVVPEPRNPTAAEENLHQTLRSAMAISADANPSRDGLQEAQAGRSAAEALAGALSPRSLVMPKALRMGGMLMVSYLVAHLLGTARPTWVVLASASVMVGPSVMVTLHRAIQRTVGTVVGLLLGYGLLTLQSSGTLIALAVMAMQTLIELMMVRNYALSVMFITPTGVLITYAGHPAWSANYLLSNRLIDTVLGSAIGLVGTVLLARRTSSRRLPMLVKEALHQEGCLLRALVTDQSEQVPVDRYALQTSLINLRVVYDAAADELPRDRTRLEFYWPVVVTVQRLGFFLLALSEGARLPQATRESLARLEDFFQGLEEAVEAGRAPKLGPPPFIPEYPVISQEIDEITRGLQLVQLPS